MTGLIHILVLHSDMSHSRFAFILSFMAMIISPLAFGQRINNPSFETNISAPGMPPYWWWCNDECTPDIQPGAWDQTAPASHGSHYLGLVGRVNGTWEAVEQPLPVPLHKDTCYAFDIDLLFNPNYVTNVWEPGVLRIWGGKTQCGRSELLYTSPAVDNTSWQTYHVVLSPSDTYGYMILETYFAGSRRNYHAVVMMDNIRNFTVLPEPAISLGNDTIMWQGQGFWIEAQSGYTYQWNDGSSGSSLYVNAPGVYSVTATNYETGCTCTAYKTVSEYECGSVKLYPVPTHDKLFIDIHGLRVTSLKLYDLLGKTVFDAEALNEQMGIYVMSLDQFRDACYVLEIRSEHCEIRKKIIISR